MSKLLRLWIVGLLAGVLALTSAAPALAQTDDPPEGAGHRWGVGEVLAKTDDTFTVRTRRGVQHVLSVDGATAFFDAEANPITFADIEVGERVAGFAVRQADGTLYAKLVIEVPERRHYRGIGVISGLEPDEQAFTFVSRIGHVWEFYVDDATHITDRAGNPLAYADLSVGQRAFVAAELRDDGQWWATEITLAVGPRRRPAAGA